MGDISPREAIVKAARKRAEAVGKHGAYRSQVDPRAHWLVQEPRSKENLEYRPTVK